MQLFDIVNPSVSVLRPVAEEESSSGPHPFQTCSTELRRPLKGLNCRAVGESVSVVCCSLVVVVQTILSLWRCRLEIDRRLALKELLADGEKSWLKTNESSTAKPHLLWFGYFLSESQFTTVTPVEKPRTPTNTYGLTATEIPPERRYKHSCLYMFLV